MAVTIGFVLLRVKRNEIIGEYLRLSVERKITVEVIDLGYKNEKVSFSQNKKGVRMKNFFPIVLAVVVVASTSVWAQGMQMPRFGPDQAKLSFLAGSFKTETHLLPNPMMPDGSVGTGWSNLVWGVDSLFLIMNTESDNTALGNYKAHGVLGFDMNQGKYILSMFNNFEDHPVYAGTFSGDTLVLSGKVQYPGGSFDQEIRWYKDGNNVRLLIFNDMGQGKTPVIDEKEVRIAGQ